MRYLSNDLIDFDEICMVMHLSRSDPIGDQKIDNLKYENPADRSQLKHRKMSYLVCPILTKFCMVV